MSVTACFRSLARRPVSQFPALSCHRCFSVASVLRAERRFSQKHEWVSKDGSEGTIGISNYAQDSLGDVVYVQLPDVGTELAANEEAGAVESVKAASEIYSPIAGEVTAVNSALEEKPGLVNSACYTDGWLFKLKIAQDSDFQKLMSEAEYENYLKTVKH